LHFEGSEVRRVNGNRANLKPVKEGECRVSRDVLVDEGQEGDDILAGIAAGEGPSVHLVVARFDLIRCFGQEGESDFGPLCVTPLRSNDEGDDSVGIGCHGLNREEKVGTVAALEIADGWVSASVPMATPGEQLNGVARV
jgi:hypothetical protein